MLNKKLGIYDYSNGDKYEGSWRDGKKDGRGKPIVKTLGVMYYANGDKYEGTWFDDKRDGNGNLSLKLFRIINLR